MVIEPNNNPDEPSIDYPFKVQDYPLPDGSQVSLWVESDHRHSEWSYFWVSFGNAPALTSGLSRGGVRPAWYRVFRKDTTPPEWKPVRPVEEVLKQTGANNDGEDEDPAETRRGRKGKVGAAEKLPIGRYVLEAKIRFGPDDLELKGIEFKVMGGPMPAGCG